MEFNCQYCKYSSNNKFSYAKHCKAKKHIKLLDSMFKCKYCDEYFERKIKLKIHKMDSCLKKDKIIIKQLKQDKRELKQQILDMLVEHNEGNTRYEKRKQF